MNPQSKLQFELDLHVNTDSDNFIGLYFSHESCDTQKQHNSTLSVCINRQFNRALITCCKGRVNNFHKLCSQGGEEE